MKQKTYTLKDAENLAFVHLKDKHFGGLTPSDFTHNWEWGEIKGSEIPNVYGIWLRFALHTYSVSFADDLQLYPIFDGDRIIHYKHCSDLSDDERKDLKGMDFFR